MAQIQKRVLLMCHDRSGGNLIRAMLGQHPDIYIIPALPIFEILYYQMKNYGDLSVDANWQMLLRDVADLYEANHAPMPHPVTYEELVARNAPRTLGGAAQAVFDILGEKTGKSVIGLKCGVQTDKIVDFLEQTNFDHALFQWRDPRDVALSVYKAGSDRSEPEHFVKYWLKWHRLMREEVAKRMKMHTQRYEQLLADPEATLNQIWAFLGLPKCDAALEYYKAEEQKEMAAKSYMWENISKPLLNDNSEKFYSDFGPLRTRRIEKALGVGLQEFGYAPAKLTKFPLASVFAKPKRKDRDKEGKNFNRQQEVTQRIEARFAKKSA